MDVDAISELGRQALFVTILCSLPAMVTGLVVGLAVSLLQSITSIQEQTLAFVPKIVATLVVVLVALPWTIELMIEYTLELYLSIPFRF